MSKSADHVSPPEACDSPIFIVGLPRSGTTLLRSLVTAHPRIAIAPETHFLNRFCTGSTSSSFEDFWRRYSETERFTDLGLDASAMRQRIIESGDCSHRNIFRTLLMEFAREKGKDRWGEKTPSHYVHLEELLQWFGQARVLWVVRDPRAVCNSLLSVWWRRWEARGFRAMEGATLTRLRRIYFDAKVWRRHVALLKSTWYDDHRVKSVLYEDLVRDPVATLQGIGEFLHEDFPDHIVMSRAWSDVSTALPETLSGRRGFWLRTHFEEAIKPVTEEAVGKWRANLTSLEVEVIEGACEEGMRWLGYERARHPGSTDAVGRLETMVARFWGSLFWSFDGARRRWKLTRLGSRSRTVADLVRATQN